MSTASLRPAHRRFTLALMQCAVAVLGCLIAPGLLSSAEAGPVDFTDRGNELTRQELDQYRGGFTTAGGFEFSFGLKRLSQINDEPVIAQTLFNIEDVIGGLTSGRDRTTSSPAGMPVEPVVIQRGAGNVVAPDVLNRMTGAARTIIQNSLDNQRIMNTTIYDVRVDNLGAIARGLGASLQRGLLNQQLVESIR